MSTTNRRATHLVSLASLESQVLALFLDRKVSTPPAMAPDRPLEHDHRNQNQAAQHLYNGKGELWSHGYRSFQAHSRAKNQICGGGSPDAENIILQKYPECKGEMGRFSGFTAGRWPRSPPWRPWAGGPPGRRSGRGRAPGRTGRTPRSWRQSRSCPPGTQWS